MDEGYEGWDKEEIARRQAAERLARYKLREHREAIETRKNMGRKISSEESIARGETRNLFDMNLVGENSSQETVMGVSRKIESVMGEPRPSFKNWQEGKKRRSRNMKAFCHRQE
jgi:hypothetical protein